MRKNEEEHSCIFCKIVNKTEPVSLVYEDSLVFAFHDAYPLNPGHILIIPKCHVRDISGLDPLTFWAMIQVAQSLCASLYAVDGLSCSGVNLHMSNGRAAGQEVMHAHLHVIPRRERDGIRFSGPSRPTAMPREQMDRYAADIREAFEKRDAQGQSFQQTF